MSAQPAGVFDAGAEPPPDSTEPIRYRVSSAGVIEARSAWVIWPILSSRLIRPSRSVTRSATGRSGS
jgi:hypothetical protein